eukprot:503269-Rhodomonas_salina.2
MDERCIDDHTSSIAPRMHLRKRLTLTSKFDSSILISEFGALPTVLGTQVPTHVYIPGHLGHCALERGGQGLGVS